MSEKINKKWVLKNLEIEFKRGYDWQKKPEERVDRYEGRISFENGDMESFSFKVKPNMAQKYIDLIAEDIVIGATGLGEQLKESLGLTKEQS